MGLQYRIQGSKKRRASNQGLIIDLRERLLFPRYRRRVQTHSRGISTTVMNGYEFHLPVLIMAHDHYNSKGFIIDRPRSLRTLIGTN